MNAADIAIQALPAAFIMSGSVVVPARRTRLPIRGAPMTIFTDATLAALSHIERLRVARRGASQSRHQPPQFGAERSAMHYNVTERRSAPKSTAKAVPTASSLLGLRHSVDAGIAQVNSKSWPWTSLSSLEAVIDPCCTFNSTLRASVSREGPILECGLPIRGLGSLVDGDARVRLVEPRDAIVAALVAEEAAPEWVLRAMEDEDNSPLSDCVAAAAWDGAGG